MPEIEKEVKTYKIDYKCDRCENGIMIYDGIILFFDPPQYPHSCGFCGYKETFKKRYPVIEYR